MAVLIIDSWQSYCSECRKPAAWTENGHELVLGYGPDNGKAGCGAVWEGISSGYLNLLIRFENGDWPQHFPEWMRRLPIVNHWGFTPSE